MFWFLNLINRNFTNVLFMITLFHWWNLPNSPIHFEISRKRKVVKINSNFRKYFSVDQKTCLTYVNSSANPTALSQALHWSFEDFIRKIKSHRYQFKVQINTLHWTKKYNFAWVTNRQLWIPTHYEKKSYVSGGGSTISGNNI